MSDATSTASFDDAIIAGALANARLVMKIDIVKPMPPNNPAPAM